MSTPLTPTQTPLPDRVVPVGVRAIEGTAEGVIRGLGYLLDDKALARDPRLQALWGRLSVGRLDFRCPAGFPSPASDFQVDRVDLPELLELDRPHVFLARTSGYSMRDRGISDGDLIVIDRKAKPLHGSIVVAVVDNEFTCKVLYRRGGLVKLLAANPDYPDIVPKEAQEIQIWGVVTSCIKRF